MEEYNGFCKLLNDALKYKVEFKEKPLNYFSVSGYPHYENVVSNILSFFFDYTKEHSFNDLWIKSLIECYNEKTNENIAVDTSQEIKISREENTEKGRIDLLVECASLIIVIENKIYSGIGNPLDSYHEFAVDKAKNTNAEIIEVLLTLNKEKDHVESGYEFINITYQELLAKIEQNRSHYVVDEKNKWVVFMDEFISNIKDLQEKQNKEIKNDWQNFLNKNNMGIFDFINKFNNDIDSKKETFKNEVQIIKGRLENEKGINISDNDIGAFGMQGNAYFSIFMNIKINGYNLALETYSLIKPQAARSFGKYYIDIWNRDPSSRKYWKNSDIYKAIKTSLESEYSCQDEKDGDWGTVLMIDADKTNWIDFDKTAFEDKLIEIYTIIYKTIKDE